MSSNSCEVLERLLDLYGKDSALISFNDRLRHLKSDQKNNIYKIIELYYEVVPLLEQQLWNDENAISELDLLHQLFRELEGLEKEKNSDDRFEFLIVIPVADRPQHLTSLMDSLLDLCEAFHYGGFGNNRYTKISVLIADDSANQENILLNKNIAKKFTNKGLVTHYFGLNEQQQQLEKLTEDEKKGLKNIVGDCDYSCLSHKGASLMRNIAYLKLNEFAKDKDKLLFYFVDSDQEFKVNVNVSNRECNILGVNYFYYLNQIFSISDTSVLTGKVVGDPPVSPAVMAGNFIDDVLVFLTEMSKLDPVQTCQFHQQNNKPADDACYHDMADLFGFKIQADTFNYSCTINEPHDHTRCFSEFINRAVRFFDGEHITRKTYYKFENVLSSIKPARTIYTGNYIFKPASLKYFIPFAGLKLRMAGPVLGRLISSEIGDTFVSANLPMLHKRTVQHLGQSEFRSGINRESEKVDLSGEFERQFFGDVMLFTIEKLTGSGYPDKKLDKNVIEQTLSLIEEKMYQQYSIRHDEIIKKLALLRSIFDDGDCWWNGQAETTYFVENFQCFIDNMERNFGKGANTYQLINSCDNRQKRHDQILNAILEYLDNMTTWEQVVGQ